LLFFLKKIKKFNSLLIFSCYHETQTKRTGIIIKLIPDIKNGKVYELISFILH